MPFLYGHTTNEGVENSIIVDTSLFTASPLELQLEVDQMLYLERIFDDTLCGAVVFTSEVQDSNGAVINPKPSHVTLIDSSSNPS